MEVSDVLFSTSSGTGTVHGMTISQVSPIKSSTKRKDVKYFYSQVTDGVKTVQLVSLSRGYVAKLKLRYHNVVWHLKTAHENNRTSIVPSPKKFKIEDSVIKVAHSPELGTLEELRDLAEHQQVSVRGKLQSISAVEQVFSKTTGKLLSKNEK